MTIAGLREAVERGAVNEGLLQAILGIIFRHSAMGPQDDLISDIWYEDFKATVQIYGHAALSKGPGGMFSNRGHDLLGRHSGLCYEGL